MPIYEYRCPDAHTFETFQRMSDPPAEVCEVCGKGPVEKLLYPVAVHFKGSGFYSTDYGRSGRKGKDGSDTGAGSSSDGSTSSSDNSAPAKPSEAKSSEAKSTSADSSSN